jgi:hypothetical protein
MKKKVYIYLGLAIAIGIALIIQSKTEGAGKSILEMMENPTEIINMIIALFIASFAMNVSKILGGEQGKAWFLITISALIFALLEIIGALKGLGIWTVSGLDDFVELCFVIALLAGFWEQKKIFTDLIKK